jgi:uncharacterized protein (TIGR03437 family)
MRYLPVALLFLLTGAIAPAQTTSAWQPVWSDEFNGAAGAPADPTKWNYDTGTGWGQFEIETNSSSTSTVFQDGAGNLVIRVTKGPDGTFTSGRLQTGSPGSSSQTTDRSWQYGLIEARIKLPFGKGVWPAFWMLGENVMTVGWPGSGEVDIMENFGTYDNNATVNNGTIHGPGPGNSLTTPVDYPPYGGVGASITLPFGETVYDDYHVYSIVWAQDSIEFFVDGASYETLTPASLPAGSQWVFNNPFYLILCVAIGAPNAFLGTPDASVTFPQDLLVDYVRVYQPTTVSAATPAIAPAGIVNAASYLGAISPGSLATLFGNNLADAEHIVPPLGAGQSFPAQVAGVTVSVNGVNAPLIYVSPAQINFQVPWETAPALAVPVQVTWNSTPSSIERVTIASISSPSFFMSDFTSGVAWVTGNPADGCPTYSSECAVKAGATYQLWANGLGPMTSPLQDGLPAPLAELQVPGGPSSCVLTIDGQPATVLYCGAAPGEIIGQVNFTYPSGVSTVAPYVNATLAINGVTGHFRVPAPVATP